jgi:hypothetical protein
MQAMEHDQLLLLIYIISKTRPFVTENKRKILARNENAFTSCWCSLAYIKLENLFEPDGKHQQWGKNQLNLYLS